MYASGLIAGALILIRVPSTAPMTSGNPYRCSIVVQVCSACALVGHDINVFRNLYNALVTLRMHRQTVVRHQTLYIQICNYIIL